MHDYPYVVSADISILLKKWAVLHQFIVPYNDFVQTLREKFAGHMRSMFPKFDLVDEDEMTAGLEMFTRDSSLPVVVLDEAYIRIPPWRLRLTRTVDSDLCDLESAGRFLETQSAEDQIIGIARALKKDRQHDIALLDDVIFSGALLETVCSAFRAHGMRVRRVYAGVGIAEGVRRVRAQEADVVCVRLYDRVIDQICERDFYPGVPLSGRTLCAAQSGGRNVGVPYCLPFGNPNKWASIPVRHERAFSQFCICQTIDLFQMIEEMSGREVRACDLDRSVLGIPRDECRFVDQLRRFM